MFPGIQDSVRYEFRAGPEFKEVRQRDFASPAAVLYSCYPPWERRTVYIPPRGGGSKSSMDDLKKDFEIPNNYS